jgi:hypothetical protein
MQSAAPMIETGEEATQPQRNLIVELSKSHVWSDKERAALLRRAGRATKAQGAYLIDNATRVITERKQREKEAAERKRLEAAAMGDTKENELPF